MKWYEIKSKADKAEIWIYEMIGEDFWTGGGITAKSFQKELSEIKASQIDLHINSPGGVVFDGITIYNLIKQHPANVTTYIDGLAASIASVIALAGDKVIMAANALYMIHNPSGLVMGTAEDMRSTADILDKIAGTMVGTYVSKTGKPENDIKALLDAETWMTADEAMEHGFIDEISEEMEMAACAKFIPAMAKAGFKHIPKVFTAKKELPSKREIERGLVDVIGLTQKQAKAILAEGYKADYRDDDRAVVTDPPGQDHRDDDPAAQRDAVQPAEEKKDRVNDLLIRAEKLAPGTATIQ